MFVCRNIGMTRRSAGVSAHCASQVPYAVWSSPLGDARLHAASAQWCLLLLLPLLLDGKLRARVRQESCTPFSILDTSHKHAICQWHPNTDTLTSNKEAGGLEEGHCGLHNVQLQLQGVPRLLAVHGRGCSSRDSSGCSCSNQLLGFLRQTRSEGGSTMCLDCPA